MYERYGASARVARYDVVLFGAGVSVDPPSSVPNGDALMRNSWHRLIRDGLTDTERNAIATVTESINGTRAPIWLEPFAEVIDSQVRDREVLVSTYVDVSTQEANANHVMLAHFDAELITVNMDTLIEAAGGSVWHLHGRWDDPESVVTTVRQYADGLSPKVQGELLETLRERNVLVLGYSGRDTDVMPLLMRSTSAQLHWLHYGSDPVAATVQRLKNTLGDRMDIFGGGAQDVLPLLPQQRSKVNFVNTGTPTVAPADLFATIPRNVRLLAVAGVSFDLGHHDVVAALLDPARFHGEPEIRRRKLLARAARRSGHPKHAVSVLVSAPRDAGTLLAWPGVLNELAATLPSAGHPVLGRALDSVVTARRSDRDAALIRSASVKQTRGNLRASERIMSKLTADKFLYQRIGVTGVVDALTVYADTLKLRGRYADAITIAAEATRQVSYANSSQRGFAIRRLAELAHVSGTPTIRISEEHPEQTPSQLLRQVFDDAVVSCDRRLAFWSAACLADLANLASDAESHRWITVANQWGPDSSRVATVYLLLVDAERQKRWGSPTAALRTARDAVKHSQGAPLLTSVSRLVTVECQALGGDNAGVAVLCNDLSKRFRQVGAPVLAARAEMVMSAFAGWATKAHIDSFATGGWNQEAHAASLDRRELLRFPWPVLL